MSGSAAYSYGFGPPDGEGFRPGAARAVSVVTTGARWMLVTAIYEPHAAGEVVDLRLTVNGRSLLKGRLSSSSEVSSVFCMHRMSKLEFAGIQLESNASASRARSRHRVVPEPDAPTLIRPVQVCDRQPGGSPGLRT